MGASADEPITRPMEAFPVPARGDPTIQICGATVFPGSLEAAGDALSAKYKFDKDGDLAITPDTRDDLISFEASTDSTMIVRIDRILPAVKPEDDPVLEPLACAQVKPKTVYRLQRPALYALRDNGTYRVAVFEAVSEEPRVSEKRVAKMIDALESVELIMFARAAKLPELDAALTVAANEGKPPRDEELATAVKGTRAAIDGSVTCETNPTDPLSRLNAVTCDAKGTVRGVLDDIEAGLKPFTITKLTAARDKLRKAIPSNALTLGGTGPNLEVHCSAVERLMGHADVDLLRVTASAILPELSSDQVRQVPYGNRLQRFEALPSDRPFALIVTGAPAEGALKFEVRALEAINRPGPAAVLASLFQTIVPLVTSTKKIAAALVESDAEKKLPQSFACKHLAAIADPDAPPKSGRTTVTWLLPNLSDSKVQELLVCPGDKCPGDDHDPAVKNRVELVPVEGLHLALLAEFSANAALSAPYGFRGPATPAFEPVGGLTGPEQAFRLTSTSDFRQIFATSLLLGVAGNSSLGPIRGWLLGLGPSLLVGASNGIFTQFNFRFGLKVAPGTYVTIGFGIRVGRKAVDFDEGDTIVLTRPAPDTGAPQEFRTTEVIEPVFGLGLAIDLAAVAGGGVDLVKAIGGK
jgi:hypothetical protein